MTVPRHGSTTESAVPGPTGRPASRWANDEGEFDLVAQGLSAANARRAAKSAAQVEQPSQPRCEPWRLPCRPCMSCHGRPARRVIRAKRAVIGRGDGATGVTMRAWSLGQRLNLAAPRSDRANTTSRNWQRGHPSLAWSLSRLGSPHFTTSSAWPPAWRLDFCRVCPRGSGNRHANNLWPPAPSVELLSVCEPPG